MTHNKSNTLRLAGAIIIAGLTSANTAVHGRPSASMSLGVAISGASIVLPNATCNYFGWAVGGTEPYTYEWSVDGSPAGDGSTILAWTNSGSSYTVTLNVSDANNVGGGTSKFVTVDPGTGRCFDE